MFSNKKSARSCRQSSVGRGLVIVAFTLSLSVLALQRSVQTSAPAGANLKVALDVVPNTPQTTPRLGSADRGRAIVQVEPVEAEIALVVSSVPETPNSDVNEGTKCVNSVQGPEYLVDSFGAVCHRNDVNEGGCCQRYVDKADKSSCKKCNEGLQCCSEFEYCVSCCLAQAPGGGQGQAAAAPFKECLKKCRTSSKSTRHGNMFMHSYKHCYGPTHADLEKLSVEPGDLVHIAANRTALSCTELCAQHPAPHTRCADGLLARVNNCEELKKSFKCKGCESSGGLEQPAMVALNAPTNLNPGKCLYNPDNTKYDCSARHPDTLRLCVCIRADYPGLTMV